METWTTASMIGMYFFNHLNGYAVGDNGTILRTYDGGNTWNDHSFSTANRLETINFPDEHVGYIAGTNGIILKLVYPFEAEFSYTSEGLEVFFSELAVCETAYWWDFGDGYFSNLSDPWHEYDDFGSYEVCLVAYDESGYSDTACHIIELFPVGHPMHDKGTSITVYPNPNSGNFFISYSSHTSIRKMELLSLHGQQFPVPYHQHSDDLTEVDIDIAAGFYILKITADNGKTSSEKIIIY